MVKKYIIEAAREASSQYAPLRWEHIGTFLEGQPSRFEEEKFNEDIALREAKAFKEFRRDFYKYVRVIIEV